MNPTALITLLLLAAALALVAICFAHVYTLWPSALIGSTDSAGDKGPGQSYAVYLLSNVQGPILFCLSLLGVFQLLTLFIFGSFRAFYEHYYVSYIRKDTRSRSCCSCARCFSLCCDDTDHFYQRKSVVFKALALVQLTPLLFNLISFPVIAVCSQQASEMLTVEYFASDVLDGFSIDQVKYVALFGQGLPKAEVVEDEELEPDDQMVKMAASLQLIQMTLGCCGLNNYTDYHARDGQNLIDVQGQAWVPASCCMGNGKMVMATGSSTGFDWFANVNRSKALCPVAMIPLKKAKLGCRQALTNLFFNSVVYYLMGALVCQCFALACSLRFFSIFY
ncbi:hypothetical protein TYRP_016769 [Tyrophagus putrescentiae]|nr:hypothetical protein TYRP_016769 [Tyrophagus putrescentiae]